MFMKCLILEFINQSEERRKRGTVVTTHTTAKREPNPYKATKTIRSDKEQRRRKKKERRKKKDERRKKKASFFFLPHAFNTSINQIHQKNGFTLTQILSSNSLRM